MALARSKAFAGKAKIRPATAALFLPTPARWIADNSRLKLCVKSRQVGWTWATSYRIDRICSLASAEHDVWYSSRDEDQAKLVILDCQKFNGLLKIGAEDLGLQIVDDKGATAHVLRFASGVKLYSLSSNPDAQAGKRGSRVLDEFALHPDPRRLYSIAYPGITWGGQMEIFSTPRGSANFFQSLVDEIEHKGNPKKFSFYKYSLQTALDEGFLYKLQEKLPADDERQAMDEADYFNFIKSGCADEESFQQEYCCNPADDTTAFLSYDQITGCQYRPGQPWQLTPEQALANWLGDKSRVVYIGIDVARVKDLTVFWVCEKRGDILYTIAVETFQGKTWAEQKAALARWAMQPCVRRICIDKTGIGNQFAEEAGTAYKYKVEGVTFTAERKEEMAYPLKAAFEDKTLRIPDDDKIRADLRAIKKETTAAGNARFSADAGENGHADRFWALALCKYAVSKLAPARISVA
jgi:phage FluMu gp28-like protein